MSSPQLLFVGSSSKRSPETGAGDSLSPFLAMEPLVVVGMGGHRLLDLPPFFLITYCLYSDAPSAAHTTAVVMFGCTEMCVLSTIEVRRSLAWIELVISLCLVLVVVIYVALRILTLRMVHRRCYMCVIRVAVHVISGAGAGAVTVIIGTVL